METLKYNINLIRQDELIIDIGDLVGIVQQLEAISQGLGMDFECVEIDEETGIIWEKTT